MTARGPLPPDGDPRVELADARRLLGLKAQEITALRDALADSQQAERGARAEVEDWKRSDALWAAEARALREQVEDAQRARPRHPHPEGPPMKKTNRKPKHTAAAVLATDTYPPGCYEPADAPICDDNRPALVRVLVPRDRRGEDYMRPIRTANTLATWEATSRNLFPGRVVIDRVRVERPLLAAAELVHGPLRWARSKEPLPSVNRWTKGESVYFVVGLRGRKRVAWIAPTHTGLVAEVPRAAR